VCVGLSSFPNWMGPDGGITLDAGLNNRESAAGKLHFPENTSANRGQDKKLVAGSKRGWGAHLLCAVARGEPGVTATGLVRVYEANDRVRTYRRGA